MYSYENLLNYCIPVLRMCLQDMMCICLRINISIIMYQVMRWYDNEQPPPHYEIMNKRTQCHERIWNHIGVTFQSSWIYATDKLKSSSYTTSKGNFLKKTSVIKDLKKHWNKMVKSDVSNQDCWCPTQCMPTSLIHFIVQLHTVFKKGCCHNTPKVVHPL